MVRQHTSNFVAGALAFFAIAVGAGAQTDIWGGGFPSDKVDVATNWVGGVVPAGYTAGTDTLEFNDASSSNLKINIAGINFAGIEVTDPSGSGNNANIYGSNTLTIGAGGITLQPSGDGSIQMYVAAPLSLSANQTWTAGYNGSIQVSGAISGSGALQLNGGSGETFEFDSGSSTFTGGVTVSGSGTTLVVGATGAPFGTGPLALGDGVTFQPRTSTPIVLANPVSFGDGTGGGAVAIGANPYQNQFQSTSVTFNGNASFFEDTNGNMDSEIDLTEDTTVKFTGPVNGGTYGVCIDVGTVNNAASTLAIFQGTFGSNLNRLDLEDTASVILDGSGPSQVANLSLIGTGPQTYLGLGANYSDSVSAFIGMGKISPGSFQGTLGFDSTSGVPATFADNIDLTNFTSTNFVGLGSATSAILTGTITPPGGLGLPGGTSYVFGGGGGSLQVTGNLVDSTYNTGDGYSYPPNAVYLLPGNGPLTLRLSGSLEYSGGTYVDGGALIFDTPVPTGGIYLGENVSVPGYAGATINASSTLAANPQSFIGQIDASSSGVVGFDYFAPNSALNITGAIDMSAMANVFLGTATQVTYSGAITPYGGTFQFSGVKGGQVTVTSPSLTGTSAVVVGLPTPIESYGSVSSVFLPGANTYSGGTTLNSGYLYVGSNGSIGTGALTVTGPSDDGTGTVIGLAPFGASVALSNNITVPYEGLHLNTVGSTNTLTLSGVLSDELLSGSLIVDGPTTLSGPNTFTGSVTVNGTVLTVGNDAAVQSASKVSALTGSSLVFTTRYPSITELDLTASTATFTYSGSNAVIDNLSMINGSQLTFTLNSTPTIYGLQSDEPGSGNIITLGSGSTLTFNFIADPDYHGTLVGGPTTTLDLASGNLNLAGSNTAFSGSVQVESGATLIASNAVSALGTGPVTVNGTLATNTGAVVTNALTLNSGGTLAGFGTISPGTNITFQAGSTLTPGSALLAGVSGPSSIPAIGTLTFGGSTSLTFGQGGNFNFGITDAAGAAGTGYSTVNVAGSLAITATSGSPFNISLYSFAPGTDTANATQAANFNASSGYAWILVSSSTGITGFSPSSFALNTSGFLNPTGSGGFYVTQNGNELVLNFSPVPEPSTWALMASGAGIFGMILILRRRPQAAVGASRRGLGRA